MTTTGVGAVISLTYAAAIDDPARFKSSKQVGAHYGITPKRYTPIPFIGEKRLARAWKRDSSWGDDSRRLS
jgi:transposase